VKAVLLKNDIVSVNGIAKNHSVSGIRINADIVCHNNQMTKPSGQCILHLSTNSNLCSSTQQLLSKISFHELFN